MNKKRVITILQLYPKDMNIYGDFGNSLVLQRRLEWYGFSVNLLSYNPGDIFPDDVDIIVGGGGQDSGQNKIQKDLMSIAPRLHELADNGTPMLLICGLYQLFGRFFQTATGDIIQGIGIFDIETYGMSERLIGNIVTTSNQFGELIGYENHSGQTFLSRDMEPLGHVRLGAGNNMTDQTEGCRYNNVIGSYLHGSLLPKNPALADFLLSTAITKKYGPVALEPFDDHYATSARQHALKRPR